MKETEAVIEAGYKTAGEASAARRAGALLEKREVREYIGQLKEEANKGEKESIKTLLSTIANASPADFGEISEDNGVQRVKWKKLGELDKEARKAISIIKNTKEGVEISLLDRMKAIELLGKLSQGAKEECDRVIIEGEEKIED